MPYYIASCSLQSTPLHFLSNVCWYHLFVFGVYVLVLVVGVEEVGAHTSQLAQYTTPCDVKRIAETSRSHLLILEGVAN